jgi:hypothetical protein
VNTSAQLDALYIVAANFFQAKMYAYEQFKRIAPLNACSRRFAFATVLAHASWSTPPSHAMNHRARIAPLDMSPSLPSSVPIVLGLLDYQKKVGGLFEAVYTTSDLKADMDKIRNFYRNASGKYPQHFGPVRVREESNVKAD